MSRGISKERIDSMLAGKPLLTPVQLRAKVESLESALIKLSNIDGVPEEVKAEIEALINPKEGGAV